MIRLGSRPAARRESLIRLASLLCALAVLGATISHVMQLERAIRTDAEGQLRTVSRILASELDRVLGQTRGLIDQVDDAARGAGGDADDPAIARLLEALPRQQVLLREIALVGRDGRVLASSDPRSIGVDVSGHDFFVQRERPVPIFVGEPRSGRGLAESAPRGTGGAGFVTLSRPIGAPGAGWVGVAVIGTDSLVNDLRDLAADDDRRIALYRYDGTPIAAEDGVSLARRTAHPIFTRFLPDRESGGFVDLPGDGRRWLAHFATAPGFPVVVEARMPQAAVTARWERELVAPLAVLLLTALTLAAYTGITSRALRARAVAQEAAATQERRLRNILDTAADGIVTIDADGVVREYNRAAETIFGVPASEAIGRTMAELMPDEPLAADAGRVARQASAGVGAPASAPMRMRTVRRDGRAIELQISLSEIVDQGEHLFTGIVRDVTEVRQAEQRFRTLFQRSGEPHLLFDDDGAMIDCNDAAEQMLRAPSREALLGRRLHELAPPRHAGLPAHEWLAAEIRGARADGVRRTAWTVRGFGGDDVPVEMTLTPIRLGAQEATLVAWHDVSERQRYEQELRAARDAAESAAQAKAAFLAMMSHELRTPMTGILGMIDLMSDSQLTGEQRRFVGVLRGSAESLLTVLNDILDYSKVEAGRLSLESIDFDPLSVARGTVDLLAPSASQRGNNLRTEFPEAGLPALRGDPTRLRQVLFNLVGNAIKFTERGTVTLAMATHERADGRVELAVEVRDTGIGIPEDVLPTLFRPFQQADSSTTRRFGGTGLGLAICRHLVEAMDGEIGVDSRPGQGSTFRFVVRLGRAIDAPGAIAAAAAAAAPTPVAARGLRLLVAEDNPTNRLLVSTRLERASHRVDVVENGRAAVEAVMRTDYDLVLMDMQMPELDGVGATRRIRALPGPRGRVPIVALTADALPEFRERYMSSGLDDYLTKPIDWAALDAVLARLAPAGRDGAPAPPVSPATRDAGAMPDGTGATGSLADDGARGDAVEARRADVAAEDATGPAARAAEAAGARVDAGRVAEVREDLSDEVWRAVLEVYWPQAELDLDGCRAAVRDGDAAARRAAAHSLKGAAGGVGFETVAARAAVLERCPAAEAAAALRALEVACETAREHWLDVADLPAG